MCSVASVGAGPRLAGRADAAFEVGLRLARVVIGVTSKHHPETVMTFIWFIVWLIANLIGEHEPLRFDPVNVWGGTLLLAAGLDLSRQHVGRGSGRRCD